MLILPFQSPTYSMVFMLLCSWISVNVAMLKYLTPVHLFVIVLQRGPMTSLMPKPWTPFATEPSVSTSPPTLKVWAMATVWSFTARWVCSTKALSWTVTLPSLGLYLDRLCVWTQIFRWNPHQGTNGLVWIQRVSGTIQIRVYVFPLLQRLMNVWTVYMLLHTSKYGQTPALLLLRISSQQVICFTCFRVSSAVCRSSMCRQHLFSCPSSIFDHHHFVVFFF